MSNRSSSSKLCDKYSASSEEIDLEILDWSDSVEKEHNLDPAGWENLDETDLNSDYHTPIICKRATEYR